LGELVEPRPNGVGGCQCGKNLGIAAFIATRGENSGPPFGASGVRPDRSATIERDQALSLTNSYEALFVFRHRGESLARTALTRASISSTV
jgi:hypothetical protein